MINEGKIGFTAHLDLAMGPEDIWHAQNQLGNLGLFAVIQEMFWFFTAENA